MQAPSVPFVLAAIAVVILIAVLYMASGALVVFAFGAAVAYVVTPVVDWLERRGRRRIVAVGVVVVTLVACFVVVTVLLVSILITQGINFVHALPTILQSIHDSYVHAELPGWLRETVDGIVTAIASGLSNLSTSTIALGVLNGALTVAGLFGSLLLLPFFMLYLLNDQPGMKRSFYAGIPDPWKPDLSKTLTIIVSDFAGYYKGVVIVGVIMFVVISIGSAVIGQIVGGGPLVTYALLLGAIAFLLEFLPVIGSLLSFVPAIILAFATGWDAVVLISVFYFIAFNIEGSVLVPKYEGGMIAFKPALVMLIVVVGFSLGGILGAILALPVGAIARDVFSHFFQKAQVASLVTSDG
jgi:predicted PurR-regulated permease PerM